MICREDIWGANIPQIAVAFVIAARAEETWGQVILFVWGNVTVRDWSGDPVAFLIIFISSISAGFPYRNESSGIMKCFCPYLSCLTGITWSSIFQLVSRYHVKLVRAGFLWVRGWWKECLIGYSGKLLCDSVHSRGGKNSCPCVAWKVKCFDFLTLDSECNHDFVTSNMAQKPTQSQ